MLLILNQPILGHSYVAQEAPRCKDFCMKINFFYAFVFSRPSLHSKLGSLGNLGDHPSSADGSHGSPSQAEAPSRSSQTFAAQPQKKHPRRKPGLLEIQVVESFNHAIRRRRIIRPPNTSGPSVAVAGSVMMEKVPISLSKRNPVGFLLLGALLTTKSATDSFSINDSNENPFNILLAGNVIPA